MNKPGKSMSPVVNKEPIKSYEEPILPFDEEKMKFPAVEFVECSLEGKDDDYDAKFGRLELVKDKFRCIEHLSKDDAELVALSEQKCDYENLKHKSDKQTFSSILDVKNDMSDLGVLEKDGNTIHSQRRYKKKFALTSDKVHSGH